MTLKSRKFILGKESVPSLILVGIVMIIIGIMAFIKGQLMGLLLIPPGLLILTSFSGVHYDPENRRIKSYTWVGFLEIGKWEPIDMYADILVLSKKRSTGFNLHGGMNMQSISTSNYEIYLANETHFDKELICRIEDKEKAYETAFQIAKDLDFEVVSYNPGKRNRRKIITTIP